MPTTKRIVFCILCFGIVLTAVTQWLGHPEHLLAYIGTGIGFIAAVFLMLIIVEEDMHPPTNKPDDGPP